MAREHQGTAASLVNTAINYSISIGLGMAGTVESRVNRGGSAILSGYRGAWYLGIGLGALGMAVSVCFILFGTLKENVKEEGESRPAQQELNNPTEAV